MPQEITLEDGSKQTVYSADELAAQAEERGNKIAEEKLAEERTRLEAEKAEAVAAAEEGFSSEREELEKLRKKDMNFENLRKSKTLTVEQEADAKKTADRMKELEGVVDEIRKAPLESAKTSFLESNFDSDDKDGREVFETFYKKLSVGVKDVKGVNEALVAAFNATTGGARQPNRTGQYARTSVNDNYNGEFNAARESEASREFGEIFGVGSDAKKQYADALKTKTVKLFSQNPPPKNN